MAKKTENKFSRLPQSPPQLFFGEKERDLAKQVSTEIIERTIGQQILYYSIDVQRSNFHPIYGEAIIKSFLPPVRVYALVEWEGEIITATSIGVEKLSSIMIHFLKKRLNTEQNLEPTIGDFVAYNDQYYEIVELTEPTELWGRWDKKVEISAKAIKVREGVFDAI